MADDVRTLSLIPEGDFARENPMIRNGRLWTNVFGENKAEVTHIMDPQGTGPLRILVIVPKETNVHDVKVTLSCENNTIKQENDIYFRYINQEKENEIREVVFSTKDGTDHNPNSQNGISVEVQKTNDILDETSDSPDDSEFWGLTDLYQDSRAYSFLNGFYNTFLEEKALLRKHDALVSASIKYKYKRDFFNRSVATYYASFPTCSLKILK
ncbi:hypothetical protein AKO1_008500, partial [Acrasis kona]